MPNVCEWWVGWCFRKFVSKNGKMILGDYIPPLFISDDKIIPIWHSDSYFFPVQCCNQQPGEVQGEKSAATLAAKTSAT